MESREFLLVFSNGGFDAWVPFEGRLDVDQSVGDYISRATITILCVSGC